MKRSDKRKRNYSLHVRLSKAEVAQIQQNAEATGLTCAALLRELGKGYKPKSIIDAGHIRELIHLRGDLGRAGGLLKLWLSSELRKSKDVAKVVHNLNSTQQEIRNLVEILRKKPNIG